MAIWRTVPQLFRTLPAIAVIYSLVFSLVLWAAASPPDHFASGQSGLFWSSLCNAAGSAIDSSDQHGPVDRHHRHDDSCCSLANSAALPARCGAVSQQDSRTAMNPSLRVVKLLSPARVSDGVPGARAPPLEA